MKLIERINNLDDSVNPIKELYNKHSYLLDRVEVSDHRYAFPMFGIECGNGWIDIIDELCCQIEQYCMDNNILPMPEVHQIKEKFACYDEETEVLTKEGWKYFKKVTKNDQIATLEDHIYLKYHQPLDIIKYQYSGKMYKLKTRGVDILVTPNHNLYVAKGDYFDGGNYIPPLKKSYPFELCPPQKYFGKNKKFKKDCIWNGEFIKTFSLPELITSNLFWQYKSPKGTKTQRTYKKEEKQIEIKKWLEFLGFYVAEGHCDIKRKSVSICGHKKEEEYILKLIKSIGYEGKIGQKTKNSVIIRIYDNQLAPWLKEECGHLAPNKKVPAFIKNLSSDLIIHFLLGLYKGDGCKQKTSHILTTISKQLADDVQELILKSGQASTIYPPRFKGKAHFLKNGRAINANYPAYEINWMFGSNNHNTQNKWLSKKSEESWVQYDGYVYCITVPNHVIMVRRNGIPVWCGNSLRYYLSSEDDNMSHLIRLAEKKSFKTCEICGSTKKVTSGPDTPGGYWISTRCDKHRRKE